jgi:hypothetical protein
MGYPMPSRPYQLFRSDRLAPRAQNLCRGLLKSGRIRPLNQGSAPVETIPVPADGGRMVAERVLRLEGTQGAFYYVSVSGEHLFRGASVDDVDELSATFADAMARLGVVDRRPVENSPRAPQSALARVSA